MINITKQVIKELCKNELFSIFFKHHFEIKEEETLIPKYKANGSIYFPKNIFILSKKIDDEALALFLKEYIEKIEELNKEVE